VRLGHECAADVGYGERTLAFLEKAVARGMKEEDYTILYRDYDAILKATASKGAKPVHHPKTAGRSRKAVRKRRGR
jgi:hypothetical protein